VSGLRCFRGSARCVRSFNQGATVGHNRAGDIVKGKKRRVRRLARKAANKLAAVATDVSVKAEGEKTK
jgi:hypothetical protein